MGLEKTPRAVFHKYKSCEFKRKVSSFCRRRYDLWCKLGATLGFSENPRVRKNGKIRENREKI